MVNEAAFSPQPVSTGRPYSGLLPPTIHPLLFFFVISTVIFSSVFKRILLLLLCCHLVIIETARKFSYGAFLVYFPHIDTQQVWVFPPISQRCCFCLISFKSCTFCLKKRDKKRGNQLSDEKPYYIAIKKYYCLTVLTTVGGYI